MKYLTSCVLFALFTTSVLAEPASKPALMRELVQAYGMEGMIADTKKAAEAQAKEAVEQMFAQVKAGMPDMGPEVLKKMQAAADKMVATVQKSWSTDEAMRIWQTEFSADLSLEELAKIVEDCKTPLGRKLIAASKRANGAFQQFILDRNKSVVEKAMHDYVAELQAIVVGQEN